MLAMPAAERRRAKLFSAAADSRATPSRSSCSPETESSRPASSSWPRAVFSSVHAVVYWAFVRGWLKSYMRENLSRILRLRTKARADVDLWLVDIELSQKTILRQSRFAAK